MTFCVFASICCVEDSDAAFPNTAPEIKFWTYESNAWVDHTGYGYYAGEAIANASNLTYTLDSGTINGTNVTGAQFTYQYVKNGWNNTSINPIYGKIASVNNSTNFTVYIHDGTSWVLGDSTIGFYKPFDDYDLATANIAFVLPGQSAPAFSTGLAAIEHVSNSSIYEVTFDVNGTPYVGYGSDCALALANALSTAGVTNNVNTNMYYYDGTNWILDVDYYGNVTAIGSLVQSTTYTAVYDDDLDVTHVNAHYDYLSLYTGLSPSISYAVFMLGFYSPLTGTAGITFIYDSMDYPWDEPGDTTGNYN